MTRARSTSSSTIRMRAFSPGPQSTRASSPSRASSLKAVRDPAFRIAGQAGGILALVHAEQHDGRARFGIEAAQQGQNLPAVHAVERGVEQDGLHAFVRRCQGLLHGGGLDDAVAVAGQLRGDARARVGVGVGQHHGALAGFVIEDGLRPGSMGGGW